MSLLANALAPYIAGRTIKEISDLTNQNVSRETLRRVMEGGRQLKLSNLNQLAAALKLTEPQRLLVLCAWIETVVGEDASRLRIEPRTEKLRQDGHKDQDVAKAMTLFRALTPKHRHTILKIMSNKELLNCATAIATAMQAVNPSV